MSPKTVEVYVNLPEEGCPTRRPTQAEKLGNGLYRLLPCADYDPDDEVWEFLPGTIVRCETRHDKDGEYFYAIAKAA